MSDRPSDRMTVTAADAAFDRARQRIVTADSRKDARIAELEAKVARVEALADGYGDSCTGLDIANEITEALAGTGQWTTTGETP